MGMNKTVEINGVTTAYMEEGQGVHVVLMHGWGQNKEMMINIFNHLKDRFHVVALDFPGFGESGLPTEAWGVIEYESFFEQFLDRIGINRAILIGHSFGCRVAIRFAAKNPDRVIRMILTGAAGIRPKHDLQWHIRTKTYKLGKWMLKVTGQKERLQELQKNAGSEDYRNATGIMRPTFVKVVNDDIAPLLPRIACPVLLVWGDRDTAAPLWMGQQMEKEMQDAGLAIFEGDDHWAYWHQPDRFNAVIDVFVKEVEQV